MSDRELLELAAKAAGLTLTWGAIYKVGNDTVDCTDLPYVVTDDREESPWYWNPLTDDGDALRLAVKTGLTVMETTREDREGRRYARVIDTKAGLHCEPHGNDPYAATRRAIVRAAAAIGSTS